MIIEESRAKSTGVGMGETRNFRANLDGMMFDNMINGIYSDKIAAPIRELSTNARDGHANIGKLDTPFEVYLPTRMNPIFKVRDFGCSLTHDEIMDMYSVLGLSTKRETNDETGCLGLGSKSPFAYTSTFTVTCWMDGEQRVYSAYKQTGGTPAISLVHRIKSKEAEGVEVSFAVNMNDVDSFNKTAKQVFIGFNPRPIIKQHNGCFEWDERVPAIETDKVKVYKRAVQYGSRGVSYAIQGSVTYPLTLNESVKSAIRANPDHHISTDWSKSIAEIELLEKTDLRIFFDIGELTTTTSREELAYDDKTCKNIAKALIEFVDEQRKVLSSRWENYPNIFEASMAFSKDVANGVVDTLSGIIRVNVDAKWKGNPLYSYFHFTNDVLGCMELTRYTGKNYNNTAKEKITFKHMSVTNMSQMQVKDRFGDVKNSFSFTGARAKGLSATFQTIQENCHWFVQLEDDSLRINNRIRHIWMNECNKHKNPLYVVVNNLSEWEKLRKVLMIPKKNITMMKDVTELPIPKNTAKGKWAVAASTKADVRKLVPSRWATNSQSNRQIIDLTDTNTKYIRLWQKGKDFYKKKSDWELDLNGCEQIYFLRDLEENKPFLNGRQCIALNTQTAKLDTDYPKLFLDYDTCIKEGIQKELVKAKDLLIRSEVEVNLGNDRDFYKMLKVAYEGKGKQILPKMLSESPNIVDKHNSSVKSSLNTEETHVLQTLTRVFPKEIQRIKDGITGNKGFKLLNVEEILSKEPLLKCMYFLYQTRYKSNYGVSQEQKNEIYEGLIQLLQFMKREGK